MLTNLHIKNFATIENLEIEFQSGFTILTGETGAGKSILIDALQLALGERAENYVVRPGAERCEIAISFDLKNIPAARKWLIEHEMASHEECIIRRVITTDSRSKSFINGSACPLQLLRELGDLLVNIHGQHEHQALLKKDAQRELVDNFAEHSALCQAVLHSYQQWRKTKDEIENLLQGKNQQHKLELLRYQAQELKELALTENEIKKLEEEHKKLANAEQIITTCQNVLNLLHENEHSSIATLHETHRQLTNIRNFSNKIENAVEMIKQALIHSEEAANEIQDYLDSLEINTERLQWIENRLNLIYQLARKHHISATELNNFYEKLQQELQTLEHADEHIQQLQKTLIQIENEYQIAAQKLSQSRQKVAQKLAIAVTQKMQMLNMNGGKFAIHIEPVVDHEPNPHGLEKIEFMVSANAGQNLQPLHKVASGGELSRIGLAIQVITAQQDNTPTLIFDEVDVGVGGGTAEIVGTLLRSLGEKAQVLCITHLPQVAAQGHQHLRVSKKTIKDATYSQIESLEFSERIQEIARMLGGVKITEQTLAHAKEMLEIV